jgi:lipooligosaccharide transport system permease protein
VATVGSARQAGGAPRVLPASDWSMVRRVILHRAWQYRRTFRASVFGSFVQPALFLAAMGLGLGGYVDRTGSSVLGGLSYLQFLAPGLLASAMMQTGANEGMFPIMGGLQWNRTFHAMFATPIRPRDIAMGNVVWMALRLGLVAVVFTAVIVAFGAAPSPLTVLAVPSAVLAGLAFSAPIMAFSATQRTPDRFATIYRFGVTPLFLFSGTFFPISGLPHEIQPLAWLSPLWHGVELCRSFMLGTFAQDLGVNLAHAAILVVLVIVGTVVGVRTIGTRLEKG